MNILYIDANIYLGFYNSNRPDFKKLLGSVIELMDKIFFTEQLGYEIDRNKLNVFRLSVDNYVKQTSSSKTILPEHLDEDSSPKLADWNKERKTIEENIATSNKSLMEILNEVLSDIAVSNDKVSKTLSPIYAKAAKPSGDDINRARLRKEIGNPPGKRADPLGDQLSWEQLLNIVPKIKRLWIVSTDKDYFTEHSKVLYLNPILFTDLIKLNADIEVKTFNILSEALRDFNKQEKIKAIPSNDELDIISKTEAYDLTGVTGSTASILHSVSFNTVNLSTCPNCGSPNSFMTGTTFISAFGSQGAKYICKNCNFQYEIPK